MRLMQCLYEDRDEEQSGFLCPVAYGETKGLEGEIRQLFVLSRLHTRCMDTKCANFPNEHPRYLVRILFGVREAR